MTLLPTECTFDHEATVIHCAHFGGRFVSLMDNDLVPPGRQSPGPGLFQRFWLLESHGGGLTFAEDYGEALSAFREAETRLITGKASK